MSEKTCTKCGISKSLNNFHCSKRYFDGRVQRCKDCQKLITKKYYDLNKEKHFIYNANRKEKAKLYSKWFRLLSAEQKDQLKIDRIAAVDSKVDERRMANDIIKKEAKIISDQKKKELKIYRSERKILMDIQKAETKIRQRQTAAALYKHQYHNDPIFKLKEVLKKRTQKIFKRNGWATPARCGKLLGADFETVKRHIESQFQPGMSWMNHGTGDGFWHIDHRMPLDSAKNEIDVYPLFHYTNLQPLWTADNIRKSNNIVNY